LWHRLVANTAEPENAQACWCWAGAHDPGAYGRLNVYVPGLATVRAVRAHVAAYVWVAFGCRDADDLWLGYQELRASGLELDHLCRNPECINPDHLDPVTPAVNCQRRSQPWHSH
jgi:hypothetical protein